MKNFGVLVPCYLVSHSVRIWFGFGYRRFDTCARGFFGGRGWGDACHNEVAM